MSGQGTNIRTEEVAGTPPSTGSGDHVSDSFERMERSRALALAGFAIPAIAYLLFIHQYGLNSFAGDQWSDVGILAAANEHALTLHVLWSQWAVERMFFPRLIVLALYKTTHFNTLIEMYVSAALLFASVAFIVVTHHLRSTSTPLLFYCPVAILMLSFVQYENTLWGFQVAWYLVLATLAVAILLLDRPTLRNWMLAAAITAGIVGSFSSFQGLLIWPTGLLLLYLRRRSIAVVIPWCAAAIVATALYFYHFDFSSQAGNDSYPFQHPVAGLKFFLFALGEVTGGSVSYTSTNYGVILVGIVILACAVWILYRYGLRRDETGARPIGLVLICFGLLWALSLTMTQSSGGLVGAAVSRFTTYDLLILVGCYLAVLPSHERSSSLSVVRTTTFAVIVLVVIFGTVNGLAGGSYTKQARIVEAKVAVNASQATRSQLLAADPIDGLAIPKLAPIAQQLRLSLFASGTAQPYDATGLGEGIWAASPVEHVVPWNDLTSGQTVEVRSGGFLPNSSLVIAECGQTLVESPLSVASLAGTRTLASLAPSPVTLAGCSERASVVTDRVGQLKSDVTVSGGSCSMTCYIAVIDPQRSELIAATEIRFRSS